MNSRRDVFWVDSTSDNYLLFLIVIPRICCKDDLRMLSTTPVMRLYIEYMLAALLLN